MTNPFKDNEKVLENEFLEIEGIKEKLKVVADKHGFTVEDLLNVIQKESNYFHKLFKNWYSMIPSHLSLLVSLIPNTY